MSAVAANEVVTTTLQYVCNCDRRTASISEVGQGYRMKDAMQATQADLCHFLAELCSYGWVVVPHNEALHLDALANHLQQHVHTVGHEGTLSWTRHSTAQHSTAWHAAHRQLNITMVHEQRLHLDCMVKKPAPKRC